MKTQRLVLIGAALVLLMCLFPPTLYPSDGTLHPDGWRFVLSANFGFRLIDMGRLALQLLCLGAGLAIAAVTEWEAG